MVSRNDMTMRIEDYSTENNFIGNNRLNQLKSQNPKNAKGEISNISNSWNFLQKKKSSLLQPDLKANAERPEFTKIAELRFDNNNNIIEIENNEIKNYSIRSVVSRRSIGIRDNLDLSKLSVGENSSKHISSKNVKTVNGLNQYNQMMLSSPKDIDLIEYVKTKEIDKVKIAEREYDQEIQNILSEEVGID